MSPLQSILLGFPKSWQLSCRFRQRSPTPSPHRMPHRWHSTSRRTWSSKRSQLILTFSICVGRCAYAPRRWCERRRWASRATGHRAPPTATSLGRTGFAACSQSTGQFSRSVDEKYVSKWQKKTSYLEQTHLRDLPYSHAHQRL
uniref:Uncharacterized protein n=1 Tax=Schistocephalus solidus TaxID=70667 RepID=A0A0X3PKE9_SCHSO